MELQVKTLGDKRDLERIASEVEKESSLFANKAYLDTSSSALKIVGRETSSTGVYVELGWASVLHKHILVLIKDGTPYSPMLEGLNNISQTEIFKFKDSEKLLADLESILKRIE